MEELESEKWKVEIRIATCEHQATDPYLKGIVMGRRKAEFLERIEQFSGRVMDVAEVLAKQRRPLWFVDQIGSSGASVGANAFEADQALSRADFSRCIGICAKESSETRF